MLPRNGRRKHELQSTTCWWVRGKPLILTRQFERLMERQQADFTLMGWLLRICPLDRLNIALCKQTEALSNRCASLAATDCIELAVLLQACNRLH